MRFFTIVPALALTALAPMVLALPAHAQALDLGGAPGAPPVPIQITASQGIQWQQGSETVVATGNAKAVRGAVTVTADQLVAHYRKKAGAPSAPPAPAANASADPLDQGNSEIYELDAIGHVHIYTATDNAWGDHAVYSLDSDVLVLTGKHLKLTTPHDVITAKDAIEYYSVKREAVARGDGLIVADDGRSIAADTLVGYLAPPATAAARLLPLPPLPARPTRWARLGSFRKSMRSAMSSSIPRRIPRPAIPAFTCRQQARLGWAGMCILFAGRMS